MRISDWSSDVCSSDLFDEDGQADTLARRKEICGRAYQILVEQEQFPPEDIIFDPNVFAVATGIDEHNHYAMDYIEGARWIRQNLPHARQIGSASCRERVCQYV